MKPHKDSWLGIEDVPAFIERFFSLEEVPALEERALNHPLRQGLFSGTRNEKGYRADSFDHRADLNIVYLGCSWVEGAGVRREAMFSEQVSALLRTRTGGSVNSWNLGLGGAGIDYFMRMASVACAVLRPDLVVLVLSLPERRECYTADGRRVSHWDHYTKRLRDDATILTDPHLARTFDGLDHLLNDFEVVAHFLRALRGTQAILEASSIPWGFTWIDEARIDPLMQILVRHRAIAMERFLGYRFSRIDTVSETDKHPGPASHEAFARQLADWIEQAGLPDRKGRRTAKRPSKPTLKQWMRSLLRPGKATYPRYESQTEDGDGKMYPLW